MTQPRQNKGVQDKRVQDETAKTPLLVARKIESAPKACFLDRLFRRAKNDGQRPTVVVSYHAAERRNDEKRVEPRRRTRLRAGKILDGANRFLADVAILDRSAGGLRLRLIDKIEPPRQFHFFDEECETIFVARLIWRKGALLGARRGVALATNPRLIITLRNKYYAMRD